MTKDEALALALHALHTKGEHHPRVYESIYAIQTVLAQPPLLEQEPTPWRDMVVATLVREGINKHKARELADHFAAQRPWQGLTSEDLAQIESDEFWQVGNHMAIAMAVEDKLKERNT